MELYLARDYNFQTENYAAADNTGDLKFFYDKPLIQNQRFCLARQIGRLESSMFRDVTHTESPIGLLLNTDKQYQQHPDIKGKYCVVMWPESQDLMTYEGFDEHSELINDENGLECFGSSAYFVEAEWIYPLLASKLYIARDCTKEGRIPGKISIYLEKPTDKNGKFSGNELCSLDRYYCLEVTYENSPVEMIPQGYFPSLESLYVYIEMQELQNLEDYEEFNVNAFPSTSSEGYFVNCKWLDDII